MTLIRLMKFIHHRGLPSSCDNCTLDEKLWRLNVIQIVRLVLEKKGNKLNGNAKASPLLLLNLTLCYSACVCRTRQSHIRCVGWPSGQRSGGSMRWISFPYFCTSLFHLVDPSLREQSAQRGSWRRIDSIHFFNFQRFGKPCMQTPFFCPVKRHLVLFWYSSCNWLLVQWYICIYSYFYLYS